MTYRTREDGYRLDDKGHPIPTTPSPFIRVEPKPRLDWLLLLALTADLGLWVGLLAWWIWR